MDSKLQMKLRQSVINRVFFENNDDDYNLHSWVVIRGIAGVDARHVTKIMADILDLPIPTWDDPGMVSGEFDAR